MAVSLDYRGTIHTRDEELTSRSLRPLLKADAAFRQHASAMVRRSSATPAVKRFLHWLADYSFRHAASSGIPRRGVIRRELVEPGLSEHGEHGFTISSTKNTYRRHGSPGAPTVASRRHAYRAHAARIRISLTPLR